MNDSLRRFRSFAPLLLALALGTGCGSGDRERVSGGEDFPNTLEALGRALAESLDSTSERNGLAQAASYPSSGALPDSSTLLASRAAILPCETSRDSGAIGDSLVFQASTRCVEGSTLRDSIVVRIADSLLRLVRQDSTGPLGLTSLARIYEADSAPGFRLEGFDGRVRMRSIGRRGRWMTVSEIVLDAGADLVWSTESDNNLWRGGQTVVRDETDTLDRWTVVPFRAGRAPIYRTQDGDSGLALLERRRPLASGAVREESAVMTIFRKDSLNYPVRSRIRVSSGPTSFLEESVLGTRDDSTFRAGEPAVYLRRLRHGEDSLREEIRMLVGNTPRDHSDDRITHLSSTRFRSGSNERSISMVATPDEPIRAGGSFTDGSIVLEVGFSNGEHIRFEGSMVGGVSTGRWTSGTDSGTVRLDAQGRVLTATR